MRLELKQLDVGELPELTTGGKIITVGARNAHHPQQGGTNYYQDLKIVDQNDENETTVSMVNRALIESHAIGRDLTITVGRPGKYGSDASMVKDQHGYKIKTKKGVTLEIDGVEIAYDRSDGSSSNERGSGERGSGSRGSGGQASTSAPTMDKNALVSHLSACQDIAEDMARRQAGKFDCKIIELPEGSFITANQVVMACRDQKLVLSVADPLQDGRGSGRPPQADPEVPPAMDDDIPF